MQDKIWAQEHDKPLVVDVFVSSFIDLILRSTSPSIADHLFSCLVRLVQIDREGGQVDRKLLKSVVDVLMLRTDAKNRGEGSVFGADVEEGLLAWSGAFYQRKTERLRESLSAEEYGAEVSYRFRTLLLKRPLTSPLSSSLLADLLQVARRAEDERSRTADYLPTQTTFALEQVVLRAGKKATPPS